MSGKGAKRNIKAGAGKLESGCGVGGETEEKIDED